MQKIGKMNDLTTSFFFEVDLYEVTNSFIKLFYIKITFFISFVF